MDIPCLAVCGGSVFAGTRNAGVWRRPLTEMVETGNAYPQRKMPGQTYFQINRLRRVGSGVAVEFAVPRSLRVLDMKGRVIAAAVAAEHQFSFRSRSAGAYLVVVNVDNEFKTIRMVHP